MSNRIGWALAGVLGLLLIAAAAQVARGGSLDPPGPVGPSMKSLDEVEPRTPISSLPFTISQPGSYYVTKDLTGVAGQDGITITSADVALDLRGFTLHGVPGALDGIRITGNDVSVAHGTVRQWPGDGIDAAGGGSSGGRYEDLTSRGNTGTGIKLPDLSVLSDCVVYSNLGGGVSVFTNATISRCIATINTGYGFDLGSSVNLSDCVAEGNSLDGIHTIGGRNRIARCSASSNGGNGIETANRAIVEDCLVGGNGEEGVLVHNDSVVRGCRIDFSPTQGIHVVGTDTRITGNTLSALVGAAIWLEGSRNSADGNYISDSGFGIFIQGDQVVVEDNTVVDSPNTGITSVAGSTLCVIEGNTVTGAPIGFNVAASLGCTIIRNVANGNASNYNIGAGNDIGPISTGAAQLSPAGNVGN